MENFLYLINQVEKKLISNIGYKRYLHSVRVMEESIELAKIFNCNVEKATIAGLLHDCGKFESKQELLKKSFDFDIIQKNAHIDDSALIHGALGAEIARQEFKVEDMDVLNAIRYHTTGRPNMSLLEKIVYISDYIEPGRNFTGVNIVRKLAYKNLDVALFKAMNQTIKYLIDKELYIHPDTFNARNYLINEIK